MPTSIPSTLAEVAMAAAIVFLQVVTFLASQWLHRRRARALDERLNSDRAEALELVRVLSGAPPAIVPRGDHCNRCGHVRAVHLRDNGGCSKEGCGCGAFAGEHPSAFPPGAELLDMPRRTWAPAESDPACNCGHRRSAHWAGMGACKNKGCECFDYVTRVAELEAARRVRDAAELCELCFATRAYCDGVGRAQQGARCCGECSHRKAS